MTRGRTPVLLTAARTPLGRYGGLLSEHAAVQLGAAAVAGALGPLHGHVPDHVYLANVLQAGNGQNPARQAAVRAGLPMSVPATTLNDVCLASMSAVGIAASLVRAGETDMVVAGGFDSMSRALHGTLARQGPRLGDLVLTDLLVHDGLFCALENDGMGPISDRANAALGVTRREQDELALQSHIRAAAAQDAGRFDREIVSVQGRRQDEGIRRDTSLERLSALRPAFTPEGTISAGNASQMSDAGAAGVVAAASVARDLGIEPMVEVVGRAMTAGPDASLHLKPADAARRVLKEHGLTTKDVGLWEINEAFAGVVVASTRDLAISMEHVNVNGGAIALGHPLGATGFRLVQTLAIEMRARGVEIGVATMCGGGGQGEAVLLRLPG